MWAAGECRIYDSNSGRGLITLKDSNPTSNDHLGVVNSAVFSADGKKFATANDINDFVFIWDDKGNVLKRFEDWYGKVIHVALSPDGKKLAITSKDPIVRIWDTDSGKEVLKLENTRSVAFSPDGKQMVAWNQSNGYNTRDRTIANKALKFASILDAESGKVLHELKGHPQDISSARFSPDGKTIATTSDKTARIWDVESGKELHKIEEHTGHIYSADFSPDGKIIVTSSQDQTTRIWDVASGKELHKLSGHSLVFSPDGKKIASNFYDKTVHLIRIVRIWDVESGKELLKIEAPTEQSVRFVAFSPNGKKMITAGGEKWKENIVQIWDVESGAELQKLEHTIEVLSAEPQRGRRGLWGEDGEDVQKELEWKSKTHKLPVNFAAFSPDGEKVVAQGFVSGDQNITHGWDVESGKELRVFRGNIGGISPDGKLIVTMGGGDYVARIWDWERLPPPPPPTIMDF
jgi:WD40 repeat protein